MHVGSWVVVNNIQFRCADSKKSLPDKFLKALLVSRLHTALYKTTEVVILLQP